METDTHDSIFTLIEVKPEPTELTTLHFATDHKNIKNAVMIKKEEDVDTSESMTEVKVDSVAVTPNLTNTGIVSNDIKIKLDLSDDHNLLDSTPSNESGEKDDASETDIAIKKNMSKHTKFGNETEIKGEIINYKCETCTKCFTMKRNLTKHLKTHSGERNYKCEICSKRFTTKQCMSKHVKTHTTERNHECEICGKCFRTKENMMTHLKTHSSEKKYKCDICSRCFRTKQYMSNHLKTHTGERKYKCEICDKRFARNHDMLVHMITHKDARDYKCDTCGKCFTTKHNLSRHIKRHIGVYKCEICNKCFTTKLLWLRHVQQHAAENICKHEACKPDFEIKNVFLERKETHNEGNEEEEPHRYNDQSIEESETGLINEEMLEINNDAIEIKSSIITIERKPSTDTIERKPSTDTIEKKPSMTRNDSLIDVAVIERKSRGNLDLCQTLNDIVMKEEENIPGST